MSARSPFEYAIIRIVPRVERGECLNVGVVLFCRTRRFLDARIEPDLTRLAAFAPGLDLQPIQKQLDHIPLICKGGKSAGPIGLLPHQERFRWIVAPRSTVIQPSAVHCGMCDDPALALDRLLVSLVLPIDLQHDPTLRS
jgi:hypothetical protein